MKKILMINKLNASFIKNDYDLLTKFYDVSLVAPPRIRGIKYPFKYPFDLIYWTIKAHQYDYIFAWWCTSFFASLVGWLSKKKVVLVAGGYDTVKDEAIKYGAFINKFRGKLTFWNMKKAYRILCVSNNIVENIKKINPKFVRKCRVIPTGYDKTFWKNEGKLDRQFITTVCINRGGYDNGKSRHLVKGIDRFVQEARSHPLSKFLIIGYKKEILQKLEQNIPPNLKVCGIISREELKVIYNSSSWYYQLSRHEGYPNAVCEALLCGCKVLYSPEVSPIYLENIITPKERLKLIKNIFV